MDIRFLTEASDEPALACCALGGQSGHDAARALLGALYAARTGAALPPIVRTARGKPCFVGSALHFSVTHTDRTAFCALASRPVGIDAEETDRAVDLRLAGKVLSAAEYARYLAAPDPRLALLRLWVLKEARAKLEGTGLRGYPNHTDFSPDDPRVRVCCGCVLAVLQEDDYAL